MFIGREKELKTLNTLYSSDKFEFVVIYGRRRVGKTKLINEFIGNKKAIYFMGVESNAKQNLENFSKSIIEYVGGIEADTSFATYQAALEYVFRLSEKERLILAIDEYPYVARTSKSLASTLQLLIDKYKKPISKRKIVKKFLLAMFGVGISSFLIFFGLGLYNKVRDRLFSQVKTPEGKTSLQTPDDLDGAVKTFLEKTNWQ